MGLLASKHVTLLPVREGCSALQPWAWEGGLWSF